MDFEEGFRTLSIQFVPFVMAVVFHEYAHGWVANRWGDPTARDQGRITLNPIPHMDLIGTIVFPIIMMVTGMHLLFGWAKPVPINPARFRKYRPGLFWVSIAGVGMNCILAVISAALFCSIRLWMPTDFFLTEPLMGMCLASVTVNYALAVFNLIPIPPLDGSKVVQSFLSLKATRRYESMARFSTLILLALIWTGATSILSYPILFFRNITLYGMAALFHIS